MFHGCFYPGPSFINECAYITIQALGDTTDCGDLTVARGSCTGTSNSTRGWCFGGANPNALNTIDYCTIASTGNYTDFGNIALSVKQLGSTSSTTRAVKSGERTDSYPTNTKDKE